jgi:NAD(P)-dependent dehydrogenase (short-subunit alcohol dehydrogenase family)
MKKTIVITGSTRGIGYGLAVSLLERGCAVMINGRNPKTVEEVVRQLSRRFTPEAVHGLPGDVTDYRQVQALWDAAVQQFGKIDIWVNNAGLASSQAASWELPPDVLCSVVDTNVVGTLYGSKVAMQGMLGQGYGMIYLMLGFGSDGRKLAGLTIYGTTKAAVRYYFDALVEEAEGTPVKIGALSPGMLATDLVTSSRHTNPENWERVKRALNLLGDRAETVVPWLAEKMLAEQPNGAEIRWLTGRKLMLRLVSAPFHKRHVVD